MGRFEVQGIVSGATGLPMVQLRQLNDDGISESGFQVSPAEAREIAQNILEAATNAVYDAALVMWAKESYPENMDVGPALVTAIRQYRADKWGLPDQPKDWQNDE